MDILLYLELIVVVPFVVLFLYIYKFLLKVQDLSKIRKFFHGAIYIALTFFVIIVLLLHLIENRVLVVFIYGLISSYYYLIMISDLKENEIVRRFRIGRIILYSIGFAIGLIALTFFFIVFFVFFLYFSGEPLEAVNLEAIIGFIVVGTALFVISLWGLTNEERRGTKDEGKKLYVTYSIMTLWIFSLVLIALGLNSFNADNNSSTVVLHINEFWGIIYIPVGLLFFSLSTIKLWKIRKKQRTKKILPFFMEGRK